MKTTNIKVKPLTNEEMLDHPSQDYNPSIWKQKVNQMIVLGAQFYVAIPDPLYSYDRFYVSYKISDGLFLFREFNAFGGSLTSRGFKKVFLVNGEVFSMGFGDNGSHCIVNNNDGRKWLSENVCSKDIMVSTDF